ncbi:integumentary mucin C.1-like [Procambarus clarkii]|uniref:integumentary mucin C.1-like n=1 Tax=Procambarus clarkii TaxID=6728 RepID=UPI003743918B
MNWTQKQASAAGLTKTLDADIHPEHPHPSHHSLSGQSCEKYHNSLQGTVNGLVEGNAIAPVLAPVTKYGITANQTEVRRLTTTTAYTQTDAPLTTTTVDTQMHAPRTTTTVNTQTVAPLTTTTVDTQMDAPRTTTTADTQTTMRAVNNTEKPGILATQDDEDYASSDEQVDDEDLSGVSS